jgi:hypothetical protein
MHVYFPTAVHFKLKKHLFPSFAFSGEKELSEEKLTLLREAEPFTGQR